MIKASTIPSWISLYFLGVIVLLTATASDGVAQNCETMTDTQIVAEVYSRIKADSKLAPQVPHINVVSINAAVKLQGWVNNQKDFDKVVDIVVAVRCVRVINVNLFEPNPPENLDRTGGCTSGTKACGDICIPVGDVCAIASEAANEE